MRKIIILIAIVLTSNTFFAQKKSDKLEVIIGDEIKLKKKERVDEVLGKDDNGTYVMARFGEDMTLFYYNNDLNLVKKNEIELKYLKHDLIYEGIYQRGEEFYLFSSYQDKKKKGTFLYYQQMNKASLTFSKPQLIGEVSYKNYKNSEAGYFEIMVSENGEHLMVKTHSAGHRKEDHYFDIVVYDTDMEEEWTMDAIKEPYDKESPQIVFDYDLGNTGSYFRLLKNIDKSKKYKRGEIDYSFSMQAFMAGEEKPIEFELELSGEHITDVKFEDLENGGIQVVGFYSTKGQGQNGVYNLSYDKDFNLINENKKEFPLDFIVQHASEKAKKKAKKKEAKGKEIEMHSYTIDDIIENQDGTGTMIAEEYYTYTTTSSDGNGGTTTTTHYIYGNIILVKFNKDGQVDWMELIPKYQHSLDGGYYSSYAQMQLSNGDIVLVFNDNPKNAFYEQSGNFYGWRSGRKKTDNTDVVFYEITEEGNSTRYIIYKGEEEDVFSRPYVSLEVAKNQMVILGQANKQTKFVKLVFED
tara:strand:+ start:18233 stop:19807 length:1575 start_codon:yes stop_codon:yes gene_type:complete